MSSSDRPKVEYDSESELVEDYKKIVIGNPSNLNLATEYLFESLVDEAVMGYAFQMHFEAKLPVSLWKFSLKILIDNVFFNFQEVFGSPTEESKKHSSSSHSDGGNNKFLNCKCMNCEKTISVSKFASHLENCMGLGRNSSRIASRKKTTNSSYYDDYDDDPESDANWSASAKEKTSKKKAGSSGNGRNGKNKNKYVWKQ